MSRKRKQPTPHSLTEEEADLLSWSYRKDHGFYEYASEDEPDEIAAGDMFDWIEETLTKRQKLTDSADDVDPNENATRHYRATGGIQRVEDPDSPVALNRDGSSSRKYRFLSVPALQRRIRAQAERHVIELKTFTIPLDLLDVPEDQNLQIKSDGLEFQCILFTRSTGLKAAAPPKPPTTPRTTKKRARASITEEEIHSVLQIFDENIKLLASIQDLHEKVLNLPESVVDALAYAAYVDLIVLKAKIQNISLSDYVMTVSVCIPSSAMLESTDRVEDAGSIKEIVSLRQIFQWAFPEVKLSAPLSTEIEDLSSNFSPAILYDAIRPSVQSFRASNSSTDLTHQKLVSKLRPYQQRAVEWLIQREQRPGNVVANSDEAEAFWNEYQLASPGNQNIYFDEFSGAIAKNYSPLCTDVRGGILSDEMGLGKTVEIISLILMNPKPVEDSVTVETKPQPELHSDAMEVDQHSEEVLCYCGDDNPSDDELEFVQCDVCRSWQHSACVAFEKAAEQHRGYICPECCAKNDPMDIATTLIVCPDTILSQWEDEIRKHTVAGAVKVLVYGGIRAASCKNRIVRPIQFADYDVVLTTYNVLREELDHLNAVWTNQRASRMKKKYRSLPSPLSGCRWWRLCIDESQKIGEGSAGAAQMASTLHVVNRWAVSGTPIQKGLEDLFGLLLFLKLSPYSNRTWWTRALQPHYYAGNDCAATRLHSLLRRVMWRNSKVDVEAELGLPPRTDVVEKLKFADVEDYLYSKRKSECDFKIVSIIEKCGGNFDRISQGDMKKLIGAILKLRQVCCHPQLGSGTGFQSLQKCTMSMAQLLDQLIIKARVECEESQRLVIMNGHGLAAIHFIERNFHNAASIYRDVLTPKEIEVDILQRIHALHNLAEAEEEAATQEGKKDSALFQAELSRIKEQETELRRQFMNRHFSRVAEAGLTLGAIAREIDDVDEEGMLSSAEDSWWHESISRLAAVRNTDFVPRVRDSLGHEAASVGLLSIVDRFRDLRGMDFTVSKEMDTMLRARQDAMSALKKIASSTNDERALVPLLAETLACSKCHSASKEGKNKNNAVCTYCKVEDKILDYEKALFVFKLQRKNQATLEEEALNKVDSECERLLRMLASYMAGTPLNSPILEPAKRSKESASDVRKRLVQDSERHVRFFELLKKELKTARTQWQAQYDYLMAVDELQMCDFRVRLRYEGEEVPESEEHAKIHPFEVPVLKTRFEAEKATYEMDYRQHISQLRYLEGLAEKARNTQTFDEVTTCPICQENLKEEIVMFQCGHEVCPACMMKMLERVKSQAGTIRCPNCRARMNADEATYIKRAAPEMDKEKEKRQTNGSSSSSSSSADSGAPLEVKGSWGTKIEHLVRHLVKLFRNDPLAKVLVFSQWPDILMLVGRALQQNGVTFLQMQGDKKKIKKILDKFKHDETIRALGLSFGKGADGLNLTEASHIVLVEPTMNPSAEQQAIGRIHRIGQTKPTTVTRLIVERSIEVNVYNLGQKRAAAQVGDLGSTSGFGARQRDADILNMDDLNALIEGDADTIIQLDGDDQGNAVDAESIQLMRNAQYWNTLVVVNNRLVPRNIALGTIQRQVYYSLREKGTNMGELENATVEFRGKKLISEVVAEIEKLAEPEEQESQI